MSEKIVEPYDSRADDVVLTISKLERVLELAKLSETNSHDVSEKSTDKTKFEYRGYDVMML